MIMHLGGDCYVEAKNVLMILDYEEAVKNRDTRLFLRSFSSRSILLPGNAQNTPKSIVVTRGQGADTVFLSPIARHTLASRGTIKSVLCAARRAE